MVMMLMIFFLKYKFWHAVYSIRLFCFVLFWGLSYKNFERNVDFYPPGPILPSILACIAALNLVESRPVGRNKLPWYPWRVLISSGGRKSLRTVVRLLADTAVWLSTPLSPASVELLNCSQSSWYTSKKVSPLVEASLDDLKCKFWRTLQQCTNMWIYLWIVSYLVTIN